MYVNVKYLTPEQIKELYPKLLANDPEVKKAVIESHLPLAMNIVQRLIHRRKEELIEEAFYQVVEAVERIIEKQEPDFNVGGYIATVIWHRLRDLVFKKTEKLPYQKRTQKPYNPIELKELMARFTDHELKIIELRMEGKVDLEIAQELGCSRAWIQQCRKQMKDKLHDYR